jgi:phosphopantothenoylcysteine decarboxylase/phosphopantothenate--cysteine ligase
MHPSDEIRGVKSKRLSGKKIVLGVTGSIAAVETIKLSRELIRHGAEIFPVMTKSSTKIVHPDSLEFATGNKPIVELTGYAEHVVFCGKVKKPTDLLLISPCTANTISKIAHGVDDTSVTTFATTAIGSGIPVLVVPAMHLSMYDHKIVQANILKCKKNGIKFIGPNLVENKAKMVDIDKILAFVFRETGKRDLSGKNILIIGGGTAEPIDDVRVIANRSSGKTAVWLAKNAFYRGADVELWYGWNQIPSPGFIKTVDFESIGDIAKLLKNSDLKNFDSIIVCAAIADYTPKKVKGKISSEKEKLVLEMQSSSKIVAELRRKAPNAKIIGFKVEEKKENLEKKAFELLKKNNLDFVVANTVSAFYRDENEIWIVGKKRKTIHKKGNKEHLTDYILNVLKEK